ncbi:MAG: Ger(x)C family spore germination protein [Bacillota bacterium]
MRPMKRRALALLLLVTVLSTLTGCWDLRPLKQRTIVLGAGIDLGDKPGELKLTLQAAIIKKLGSPEGGGEGDAFINLEASGTTVQDAVSSLQEQLDRELFFGHIRVIAFAEEYAKLGIDPALDYFVRDPNVQRLVQVTIAKGKAKDLFEAKIPVEPASSIYLANMLESADRSAMDYRSDLGRYLVQRREPGRFPGLPVVEVVKEAPKEEKKDGGGGGGGDKPKEEKVKFQNAGTAIFYGGRLQGLLSPEETGGVNLIQGNHQPAKMTVPIDGPQNFVTVVVRNAGVKTKIDATGIHNAVTLEGDIIEQSMIRALSLAELNQAQAAVAARAKALVDQAVQKSQALRADPFGYGYKIYTEEPSLWKGMAWQEAWPAWKVTTAVKVAQFRRRGTSK